MVGVKIHEGPYRRGGWEAGGGLIIRGLEGQQGSFNTRAPSKEVMVDIGSVRASGGLQWTCSKVLTQIQFIQVTVLAK